MRDAVRRSSEAAQPGDIVLLAPACASFDMFKSFEHRGQVFKSEVKEMQGTGDRGRGPEKRTDPRS
jgi:UDP-N-acetylmuramoylalanine--D-glutamate ligase